MAVNGGLAGPGPVPSAGVREAARQARDARRRKNVIKFVALVSVGHLVVDRRILVAGNP
jgi:hypothetical protein